ncbi:thrombospondin-related adhesive protein [Cryptosporidium felis]|nr:thrombospondin-related adhesive protein [Cryptosporidium felis]
MNMRIRLILLTTLLGLVIEDGHSLSCVEHGVYYKGFTCGGLNGLEWWKANSWFECRERCKSNLYTLIPCKYFAWDSNGGMCTLQNGDTTCKQNVQGVISGKPDAAVTGPCATTCTVGPWSSWSATCVPKVYGGITYRTRSIVRGPSYPLEKCPHLQEVVNCNDKNWGKMSDAALKDENSALNHVISGVVLQSALGKDTSAKNCPNYDVGLLGWGCNLDDNLEYGNLVKTTSYTWQDCLNRCKQRGDCQYFNFRETNSGVSPCYLILGEIGCSFHSLGWISGSRNLEIKYGECDINCVLGEWSNWTGCDSAFCIDGKAYSKRVRSIITSSRGMGSPCSKTRELRACTASYTCQENSCVVGPWSAWSSCKERCDGKVVRRRTVQQIPSPGGNPCPHLFEISEPPNCGAFDPVMDLLCKAVNSSPWGAWSSCTATCGGGFRIRRRTSIIGTPTAETCNTQPCSTYNVQECKLEFGSNSLNSQFNRFCLVTGYSNSRDLLRLLVEHNFRV